MKDHGIHRVQFNMSCAGGPSMPEEISRANWPNASARAMDDEDLTMSAVSGTFNMIHPDRGGAASWAAEARDARGRLRAYGYR